MKGTLMRNFHDFDLDEGALWPLCESASDITLKKIAEVDRKRREVRQIRDEAEKANGLDKLCLENDAKHLGLEIEDLMKDVGHFEHGRS
jgi:hypothetical protein